MLTLLLFALAAGDAQLKLRATETTAAGRNFSSAAAAQSKMSTFQLVLLKKGTAAFDAAAKPALTEHGAWVRKLAAEKTIAAAGGFRNSTDILGIIILRVPTVERGKEIAAEDPAVKAGLFMPEILSFMAEDRFQPWAEPAASEALYFGFLNSGPNRSQDKETAAQLQKEHLAYMGDRDKERKLLFAGPFLDGGTRRGIVIYRMPSLEEAKQVGEGDPMIKAGRLALELFEWRAPKGALK